MSDETRQDSPLSQFAVESNDQAVLQISERPFHGHINLRGDSGDDVFLEMVKRVLGFELPIAPNTVSRGTGLVTLWLGPDEWHIITPPKSESTIAAALEDALNDMFCSVTDQTGGQTMIRLSGSKTRNLLAKGCTLDLHPRFFVRGQCAQTLVAKAMVTIIYVDDTPTFDLVVRRSFADYLRVWFQDASREYGLLIQG